MDKTETKEMEGVEPILIQAGDKRVLLNGFPPILPIRVVAEAKYQEIISELQKAKELNGELVNRSAQQLKEYRDVIRELLPISERMQSACESGECFDYANEHDFRDSQEYQKVIDRARKLIDQTDSTK